MKLVIAGGGTGGHLFPGIAIAEEVRARGGEVLFVGTALGIEARVVPAQGWPLQLIDVSGIKRKGFTGVVRGLGKLPAAFLAGRRIVKLFGPDLVLGVGGYASGPVVLAAAGRVPTAILEQNSIPGVTNRMLGRVVDRVYGAFEESRRFFPSKKFALAGNPIRRDIRLALTAAAGAAPASGPVRLFVCGGSQGAQAVNERVCEAVRVLAVRGIPLGVLHQTGQADVEATRARYAAAGIDADVRVFIHDMASAYRDADIVVARAGATTIAELTAIGRATVFIPFPFAADDHQTVNAASLVRAGAALSLAQDSATGETLAAVLATLAGSPETRAKMAQLMRERGKPEAAREIVDSLRELCGVP